MKKQKKNDKQNLKNSKGITLIALVISIIVMLILAGVSLNAVVGQNGVLTQAQNATIANRKASILENLDLELASYNIETITGNPAQATAMFDNLISKELIDTVLDKDGTYKNTTAEIMGIPNFDGDNNYTGLIDYAVKKDDYSIVLSVDDSGIYKADYGIVNVGSGGSVSAGTTLVTSNAFESGAGVTDPKEKGKFTIDDDASVMFVDVVSGELSILVKSGKHAKVSIFKNMTLTNAGVKRSAIDIETGGTLDLYVAEGVTVTVNSGLGEDSSGNTPGKGGYAGIHVPEGATLNLKGNGTIKAIGGNAGNGDLAYGSGRTVTAGGGGAGAGIGGNGGDGAAGKYGQPTSYKVCANGGNGKNCGNINIYNKIKVYAYGGAGGSGGTGGGYNHDGSGGGGGYPGAGIGGGGAGAGGSTCCTGGSGYTAGSASGAIERSFNGLRGKPYARGNSNGINPNPESIHYVAGGYFYGTTDYTGNLILGGYDAQYNNWLGHQSGSGGNGGNGGTIKASNQAEIYAFNGNYFTDGLEGHEYGNGLNQCPIYLQAGIVIAKYSMTDSSNLSLASAQTTATQSNYENKMYISSSEFKVTEYVNKRTLNINTALGITGNPLTAVDMSKQGVGSGAGYNEISNGTYIIDSSLD